MITEVRPRPAAGPPRVSHPSALSGAARRLGSSLATTPGRLRLASVAMVAVVVLAWVVSAAAVGARRTATDRVGLETEPLLVGTQAIYAGLADADATAATAFLTGGLEPASLRARYDSDVKAAADQLAAVTRQAGSSSAVLTPVQTMTDQLGVYTGLVEDARANNRQGFPVGAAYLRQASVLMQKTILPAANQLYQVESGRLDSGYRSGASAPDVIGVVAAGLAMLAVVVATQLYLTRRTHRVFNIPLLAASVLAVVLVAWVVGVFAAQHQDLARAQRDGSNPVKVLAQARILALRSQSDESLTLISRGNGQAYSDDFTKVTTQLGGLLPQGSASGAAYQSYMSIHNAVQKAAANGDFAKAVDLAVGKGVKARNEAQALGQLNTRLAAAVTDTQQHFNTDAASARHRFGLLSIGIAALAAAIGLLALFGTQLRINDYR